MGQVRIKIKAYKDKACTEYKEMQEEEWVGTEFFCLFCGSQSVVLRKRADDKCACLACEMAYYVNKPKSGKNLSNKDIQRLGILKHRWEEMKVY